MAFATSHGWTSRPSGRFGAASSSQFSGAPSCSIWVRCSDSVSIQPGLTWLTRIPWRSSANARFRVIVASAPLEIE